MDRKRISVNTSLKNARIFDDDSWDAESAGLIVKNEPQNSEFAIYQCNSKSSSSQQSESHFIKDFKIKAEIKTEIDDDDEESKDTFEYSQQHDYEHDWTSIKIKSERSTEHDDRREDISRVLLKTEDISTDSFNSISEENYLDNLDENLKNKILNTPNGVRVKRDILIEDSNPSPFNKELFKNFNLGQGYGSPDQKSSKYESRKSVKRSVFTRLSPRLSPYKKYEPRQISPDRLPAKKRLGPKVASPELPRRKKNSQELESDPEVLARRQKQIDFGKNTIGYDTYIKKVPKYERAREDAQTPNKFIKYSRRGWDGLIKQWRLKLHKYDPADD